MEMSSRRRRPLAVAIVGALALAGCGGAADRGPEAGGAPGFPMQVDNCGQTMTLARPPSRIVTSGTQPVNLLTSVGAANRIVGRSGESGQPLPVPDADAVADVPVLTPDRPTAEIVIGSGPDLLYGDPPGLPEFRPQLDAAGVLGTGLRHLEEVRTRTTEAGDELPMHTDGINVVVDIHGRHTRLRDHDIDYVLVQCEVQADVGGASFTADGYRLIDRIRHGRPDLYEFLTSVDVDFSTGVRELDAHRQPPRACRMVEWTRGGRMVSRAYPWAVPVPLDPHHDEHRRRLGEYADLLTALSAVAPDHLLAPGEIEILDSYRCPHGVRGHEGTRRTHVLSCKSVAAL